MQAVRAYRVLSAWVSIATLLLDHRPASSLHATDLGPPRSGASIPAPQPLRVGIPDRNFTAPHPLFAWATAQPRASPHSA